MAELQKLLKRLRSAEKKDDFDKLDATRQLIIDEHGDTLEAAEARYRLGLSKLLRHKQLKEAEELFTQAAQTGDQYFAPAARVSLALVMHAQKRTQKALFELRKVVGSRKPTPHSAVALAFIVTILRDSGAKAEEVTRARGQQIVALRTLLGEADPDATEARAQLALQLAAALVDQGEGDEAKTLLEEILAAGEAIDVSTREEAKAALAAL
jgi:tetratricopeptide (TPR) repeat protein